MHAKSLGKDPDSQVDNSPTLFATDRTDRVTYIAQGWKVTDPQVLADVGPVPDHETLIEIPSNLLDLAHAGPARGRLRSRPTPVVRLVYPKSTDMAGTAGHFG